MNVISGLMTAAMLLVVVLLCIGGVAGFLEICREHRRMAARWQHLGEDNLTDLEGLPIDPHPSPLSND